MVVCAIRTGRCRSDCIFNVSVFKQTFNLKGEKSKDTEVFCAHRCRLNTMTIGVILVLINCISQSKVLPIKACAVRTLHSEGRSAMCQHKIQYNASVDNLM